MWDPCSNKCKYCGTMHLPQQYPVYGKNCGECSKDNHLKVVYRSSWRQQVAWQPKMPNKVHQKSETSLGMLADQDLSFDTVRVEYINLNSIKSILFTKLESSTSKRPSKMTYNITSWANSNCIQFNIVKCIFPQGTLC